MNTLRSGAGRSIRLLAVDDDEGALFLISDILRREGYEVHAAECGEDALQWLRQNAADLLLLDLKLPDVPAPELVERLKTEKRELPFIVITGNGDERTAVEVMKQGALDYVMKGPGLLDLLPTTVRRALATVTRERELRHAYDAIQERERRYKEAIQTALDGFARFDRGGRFLEANEALCTLLGYSEQELTEMSLADPRFSLLPREITERILHLPPEGSARLLTRLRRSDATECDVTVSVRSSNSDLFAFVHDLTEQRRLERNLLEISENERRRFGRDLHDSLGQCLTAVELISYTHAQDIMTSAPQLAKAAETINTYIRQAGVEARKIAHGMAPVKLDSEGLMEALNNLAQLTTKAGIACDFDCNPPVYVADSQTATHLFRIAQEAVNNALKYSCARQIHLNLEELDAQVQLTIADNGFGFPREKKKDEDDPAASGGMGLQVMDYRAKLIGGELQVHSECERGVKIVCRVPIRH